MHDNSYTYKLVSESAMFADIYNIYIHTYICIYTLYVFMSRIIYVFIYIYIYTCVCICVYILLDSR